MSVLEIEVDDEVIEGYEHPDPEDDEGDLDESLPVPKAKKSKISNVELEEMADALLREDSNRELCRQCVDAGKKLSASPDPKSVGIVCPRPIPTPPELPYGHETGEVEWQIQKDKETGDVLLDSEGNALYVVFPELKCDKGHRWYKGEGPRRNINGLNPILFETHLYNRKRREIYVKDGVPDPAFTMDRWNKRPTAGMFNRVHPLGRKTNSPAQRKRSGASFYR